MESKFYEYVEIELENHKATTSELSGHHEIIEEYTEKGYTFCGSIPTLYGPSGKVLKIELIFKK
ncbi:MAG: DUF4177 domain-containing protein [Ruminococcus sp.]|nr:DUF4177 domain-containing protein [Ruminococcus sp.]